MIHNLDETVYIRVAGGFMVQVKAKQIVADLIKRLQANQPATAGASLTPPAIGQAWPAQGGIYAGVVCGGDSERDYHLIIGPDLGTRTTWVKMQDAAAACEVDGHKDFILPLRREQSIAYANVPKLFEKAYYWSAEEYAGDPGCAWFQYFNTGDQHYSNKGNDYLARAVRRLPMQ